MAAVSVLTDKNIAKVGDFDSVNVILRTASGKQAIITNSRRATYGYEQRIEVLGAKGIAQAENRVVIADKSGLHAAPLLNFFMTRYIAAFVAAVQGGTVTPTTTHGRLKALAEAALKSVTESRAVKLAEVL